MSSRRVVLIRESQPLAGTPDGVMQGLFQQFARRQLRQVLRDSDAALVELEQLDVLLGLVSAEDQAEWRLLAGPGLELLQPAEV